MNLFGLLEQVKLRIPEEAQEVHKILRDSVKSRNSDAGDSLRIIYGGSVKPSNAQKAVCLS